MTKRRLPRYSSEPFPPYRYVPGEHPHPTRDPRGHSSGTPEVTQLLSPDSWQTCAPYLYAIDLFNHGYWWEAHEALEPFWRAADRNARDGLFLQGLIQVAAALLRHSMGTVEAARAKAEDGCAKMRRAPELFLGIDVPTFVEDVRQFVASEREASPIIHLTMPDDPR